MTLPNGQSAAMPPRASTGALLDRFSYDDDIVRKFMWATLLTTLMLLGPKLMGWSLAFFSKAEREAFGGRRMLAKGLVSEMALSAITAPIYMIGNTRAVYEILTGRDAGWTAQVRDGDALSRKSWPTCGPPPAAKWSCCRSAT